MAETYTTNFTTVSDGDTTDYTPQNLVQKNALINVIDAEAQWKGISNTTYDTDYIHNRNSDTAKASIKTTTEINSNSSSGTTSGDTNVETDSRTQSRSKVGSFGSSVGVNEGGDGDPETVNPVQIPDDAAGSANTSIELDSLNVEYYLEEDSGGADNDIAVLVDDDPYDWADYDTLIQPISIDANESKKIAEYTWDIDDKEDYQDFDGASMKYWRTGERFGTTGFRMELTLNYTVKTIEQTINQETIRVDYPSVPSGATFEQHVVEIDNPNSLSVEFDNKVGETVTEQSPTSAGETKTVTIRTYGEKRQTINETATASYPSTPNGWSFERYDIEEFRDGNRVRYDRVYSEREGQTESITSSDPGKSVEIEITGFFSKTTSTTTNTVNPSLKGDFIPGGLNTDNVVFTIDSSSSVNQTKQQDFARQVLSQLPDSSNVGLVEFDFDANIVQQIDSLSSNRSDIENSINSIDNDGGTEMINGLSTARDMLSGLDGTVVLISDGETSDDPTDVAADLDNDGIQIVSIAVESTGDDLDLMEELSDVSNGFFFDGSVDSGLFGTTLSDNELSSWVSLSGITRTQQTFTHEIGGTGQAEFRWRFTWEFDTPQPRNGTTGFYDDSAGVWREAAVANPDDESLEYNHITIYNNSEGEWGALDVVDVTNENAIESHQFYDEDAGWLAPREFDTV